MLARQVSKYFPAFGPTSVVCDHVQETPLGAKEDSPQACALCAGRIGSVIHHDGLAVQDGPEPPGCGHITLRRRQPPRPAQYRPRLGLIPDAKLGP